MLDQHLVKDWNYVQDDFTSDLHCTLRQLGRYQRTRDPGCDTIEPSYETAPHGEPGPFSALVRAGFALVITLALFGGAVAVLTSPTTALATPVLL